MKPQVKLALITFVLLVGIVLAALPALLVDGGPEAVHTDETSAAGEWGHRSGEGRRLRHTDVPAQGAAYQWRHMAFAGGVCVTMALVIVWLVRRPRSA